VYPWLQYDARIVRRWNVDPVPKVYESPYLAFAGNPIWIMDPNGADTTPVFNRIIDRNGNQVTTPTVVDLSGSRINPRQYPGMRVVGNNRVEVTPGDFMAEDAPSGGNTQIFTQSSSDVSGGNKFTWTDNNSNGVIPPVAAPPILQFNNQITNVQNVNGQIGNVNQNFNIPFNPAGGPANAARFVNPASGLTQINQFITRLRNNGIFAGVNITIGTDLAGPTSAAGQFGNAGGLVAARGNYIRGLFVARGITVNLRPPAWGTAPNINARINQNVVAVIGWNVTTQAMQRQVLTGNVVPGFVQPVPNRSPANNFQPNNGGARPTVGNFTGTWQ
jgi:hypothetical protein